MPARLLFALIGLASAMSMLVALDLGFESLCLRLPLAYYVVAGVAGGATGWFLARWIAPRPRLRRVVLRLGGAFIAAGLFGAVWLTLHPPQEKGGSTAWWGAKCAAHHCARVLGPGFLRSPYPVPVPRCSLLSMCANEYPFSEAEQEQLLELMTQNKCRLP